MLSSGECELRDQLLGGDKRAARDAINVTVTEDGTRTLALSMEDKVKYALLTRMIARWGVGQPIPSLVVDPVSLLDSLPLDDLDLLSQAIDPVYDRIMGKPQDPKAEPGTHKVIPGSVSSTTSSGAPAPPAR
jgi:hypothetical protein